MDRSFLSQPAVIAASRNFVCIRLATYEDRNEAAFLKKLFVGGSGEVENTTVCLLSPDGQRKLIRAHRSTRQLFRDAQDMADTMNRLARQWPALPATAAHSLPLAANVRLAVNVAACDNQPLVLVTAQDAATRQYLLRELTKLAWSKEFIGQFIFAALASPRDLALVEGSAPGSNLVIVQPDRYGRKGTVLKQLGPQATPEQLSDTLREAQAQYQRQARSFAAHVHAGHQAGIFWETLLPVTDPMERQARQRGRQQAR